MFKFFSLIYFLFLTVFSINGQNTLTLQPNATNGKDAFISSNVLTTGQGNSEEIDAGAWTISGSPLSIRSLIDFNLTSLPIGATIQSAVLTLYNNPNAINGYANGQHVHASGSNDAVLQRITSPWTEDVAWNNQPTTTSQNQVTLAQDNNPNQDYVLDVTNLLQDIIANQSNSFGFLLKLNTETPYRLLAFASSDHPNAMLHPKLEICYSNSLITNNTVLQNNTVSVFPNPTSGIVNVELKNLTFNTTSNNRFEIFDLSGKKVFENKYFSKSSLVFDVSNLQSGMYFWVVTTDQIKSNGKLIMTK